MKAIQIIILLFCICPIIVYASPLYEGRYYLQSDVLAEGLCDLIETNGTYFLTHIEKDNTIIKFKIDHKDKIIIEDTVLPTSEFWSTVTGSAKLQEEGIYSGKVKISQHYIP